MTGFGPYYGDACSDLEDFERSLDLLTGVDAQYWLTFHHKGLIESRERFLEMLAEFKAVIGRREQRLLDFMSQPRTLEELVEYRIIYRPGTGGSMVDNIEKRSIAMHLKRLQREGVVSVQGDTYFKV